MGDIVKGLEGVTIGESRVSLVDGEEGEIWYAGYHLDDLVEEVSFEEMLFLLWNGDLPTAAELADFEAQLAARRSLPEGVEATIAELAPRTSPMNVLRTAVSMLAGYADEPGDLEAHLQDHLADVIAKMPTIVAATYRHRNGLDVLEPRDDLGHAANFRWLFFGEEPDDERVQSLDNALVLYAEHGMNASTFAAVVVTSTLANPYASMDAAIGALEGPLHGGATRTVTDMLEEIGGPEHVEPWVGEKLETGERIPGFGHRVYSDPDPRCKHFRREIERADPNGEIRTWFETAKKLDDYVQQRLGEKGIAPNTDLYSGIFYRTQGIPPAFTTPVFAMGRVAGWSAHVIERVADNRILRPRVEYAGKTGREFVPIDQR